MQGNGDGNTAPTLTGDHQNRATDYTGVVTGKNDKPTRKCIVRRLTPLECCRLQGFPHWWEDGVEGSDSDRYKMWGNGIALPCAVDVLARVAKAAELRERLRMYEAHGVMPDELESLKLCRHNCKIDCLLKKYNELKERYDHECGSVEEHGEL